MASLQPDIHYFGIRHHGPSSTRRLLDALTVLQPDCVLIEGPADCGELLPLLAQAQMCPPVALLAYAADSPEQHLYYPFTQYSPEYQASLWAVRHQADLAFIDIPVNIQLAAVQQRQQAMAERQLDRQQPDNYQPLPLPQTEPDSELTAKAADETNNDDPLVLDADPIGALARLAGYQDGESWWNDYIEIEHRHNLSADSKAGNIDDKVANSQAVFASIANAIAALREVTNPDSQTATPSDNRALADEQRNDVREAYMRLQIDAHSKRLIKEHRTTSRQDIANLATDSPPNATDMNTECPPVIAVVCGAWHVPALQASYTLKQDKACLKLLPKKLPASKVKSTWIPWTSARLSRRSGYGAGVSAPMWYQHLWDYQDHPEQTTYWIQHIAQELRQQGQIVSTASLIETVRLSDSLAAVRGRPSAGFEEITDAVIACLCFGESILWQQVADRILLGHQVGHIPADMPLAPLLEDLQRQQKRTKLKPEALERMLSLDLRTESGSKRSILLHRLAILDVPWGRLGHAGGSRGTFRENWELQWQPEYSVQLVENLIYGNSIEQAANNKLIEIIRKGLSLEVLAEQVQHSLTAQLHQACEAGLYQLNHQAAHSSDADSLLGAIVPLIHVSRYGTARQIDLAQVQRLVKQLVAQAALALPYACRNLNAEQSNHYRQRIQATHDAVLLADLEVDLLEVWWQSLTDIAEQTTQPDSNFLLAGLGTRLLYQADKLDQSELHQRLQRSLSPAIATANAADYFDGFFAQAVQQLQYDKVLLSTLQEWLMSLEEEDFVAYLPLFKRVFADMDKTERQRLLHKVLGKQAKNSIQYQIDTQRLAQWQAHQQVLHHLLTHRNPWSADADIATKETS